MLSSRSSETARSSGSVEKQDSLRDIVEQELVEQVCLWSRRVLVVGCAAGAVFGYIGGEDPSQLLNPAFVSLFGILSSFIIPSILEQMAALMCVLTVLILRHSLNQGCSACLVPAIYGFIPCASGFLFRTSRAVAVSTVGVLAATLILYVVDLSGHCTSDPLDPNDRGTIIADRLVPLLMLILGNGSILTIIVRQSQDSLRLHAKAAKSASDLADMRRDVLHRVTHELRTPLNAMVGSVELLTASETMPEMDMENAMTIKRCLSTILNICDNVLMAAKSDAGNNNKQERPFLLASCIDGVAEFYTASVEAKGVELKVEYDGDSTAMVRGMEIKLRQVLLNLVGNSLKFTERGSITIRVKTTQSKDETGDMLHCRFEVQDTGVGIEQENSELLFEAFHQGEQGAVSRRHKGTGLGLAICRDFVELMGGKIAVEGKRGQGARFYFSLSMKKEEEIFEGPRGSQLSAENETKSCRIVIADSEQESLTSCRSIVESTAPPSASVSCVQSLEEVLDIIEEEEGTSTGDTTCRVVFLASDSKDRDALRDAISRIKQMGWIVFVYCHRKNFREVATQSSDAYAVFRRPLQIERMTQSFRGALLGQASGGDKSSGIVESIEAVSRMGASKRDQDMLNERIPMARDGANSGVDCTASSLRQTESPISPTESSKADLKVVVVDDTAINVKVMSKMLSRSTSFPIVPLYDGQSAIELVEQSSCEDVLLFLMDWHMPLTCGITATESIRRITKERGGPRVFICMITADLEGLQHEMENRKLSYDGILAGDTLSKTSDGGGTQQDSSESVVASELSTVSDEAPGEDEYAVLDIVAGKPLTFKSIQAILNWFQEESSESGTKTATVDTMPLLR